MSRHAARHAQKRDANEPAIVAALREEGAEVLQLDAIDLLVGYRGANWLIECKMPGEQLRPSQVELHSRWERVGQIATVWYPQQAVEVIRGPLLAGGPMAGRCPSRGGAL